LGNDISAFKEEEEVFAIREVRNPTGFPEWKRGFLEPFAKGGAQEVFYFDCQTLAMQATLEVFAQFSES
jgi:hypothetical protein